ncbi:PDI-like 1-4 [Actinidia rufa]|uniref:Protein disulfide-isomerase n=1 Tax=Actinidia rufa TaxID=165716 RepID=A0A7J0DAC5_9ERIC|nr:PDI-like 1-4 [Actinidia rufa]
MTSRLTLVLSIFSLLLVSSFSPSLSADTDDLDEFLTFLESDQNDAASNPTPLSDPHFSDDDVSDDDFENYDDFEVPSRLDRDDEDSWPAIDDKDVVVLGDRNLSGFVESNRYVMVEFYAPWCGHCQSLAPEYAAAATVLKDEAVALAKVDATEERELAAEYEVQGFPTVYFFVDGEHQAYTGQRTKEAIVTWIKKKIGPGVYNISMVEDAEHVLTSENKVVLGFLESLVGPESEELSAASKLEDDINFYQTVNPDVAKLFHMDPDSKRPALVMLKREEEKLSNFDGQFKKSVIAEFVSANKLPLVNIFTRESGPVIFESPIKKQVLLFATSNDSEKVIPTFQDAAKAFKGKLIFVYVEMDNVEVGRPVADYFGITGNSPKVIGYSGNNDGNKYVLEEEPTLDKIKAFGDDFVQGKLKPFYKSDPIPVTNDEDVKTVVGNNFDDIVLDESKDVLLEIYAPWCGHCQALEPTYTKLAKHLRAIESLVIDGHGLRRKGFPRFSSSQQETRMLTPLLFDTDRTVVALYKFIKKHASIPFKLKKPVFHCKT